MSECSGPDCKDPSHDKDQASMLRDLFDDQAKTNPETQEIQERVEEMVEGGQLPPIVTVTDPRAEVLSLVSRSCDIPPSADDLQASSHMTDLLEELGENAVALAAPQIGIPRRFFVMRLANGETRTFFNPIIRERSATKAKKQEGCLSVTGASVRIARPRSIRLEYIDITGERQEEVFNGLQARAVCHEVDHLNGRIIMEHMAREAEHKAKVVRIKKMEKMRRTKRRRAKNKLRRQANQRNRR